MILVEHVKLHWRFYKASQRDEVWSVLVELEEVKEMSLVLSLWRSVGGPWSAEDAVVLGDDVVLDAAHVFSSLNAEALADLGLENSDGWLLDGEVGHLNIETMEVDSLETVGSIASQLTLAHLIEPSVVWDSAGLMELSEEVIEGNDGSSVGHELVPVGGLAHNFVISFELIDDLLEVPGEGEDVSVLVL